MENISASNIKLLVNYYNSNKVNKSKIIEYYKPVGGYLYCMFNPMYKYYGENVKKCGNSIDADKRKYQYTTSYLEESEFLLISEQFFDKTFAETLLFNYLNDYRMRTVREFFNCDINIVKDAFEKVKHFFKIYNNEKKLFNYLIENYDMYFINNNNLLNTELTNDEIIELTKNVLENNEIIEAHKKFIYMIKNAIEIKKKYLTYFGDIENHTELLCDNEKFKKYIITYCMNLSKNEFIQYINNNKNLSNDINENYLIDKINAYFWLEEILNFNRYKIQEIKCDDINKIKKKLNENTDLLYFIFKNNEGRNKIIKSIKHKINLIKNENYLQKFIAECYNNAIENHIYYKYKQVKINRKLVGGYIF